jgi:hypothetical protein
VIKPGGTVPLPDALMASRGAYLFFSLVGFFIAILLFAFNLFNLISVGFFGRLPWSLIVISLYVFFDFKNIVKS